MGAQASNPELRCFAACLDLSMPEVTDFETRPRNPSGQETLPMTHDWMSFFGGWGSDGS